MLRLPSPSQGCDIARVFQVSQSAIVVMTNIRKWFFQLFADFSKGISFKENQSKGLLLLFSQFRKCATQYSLSLAQSRFVFYIRRRPHHFSLIFDAAVLVEPARLKIFTAIKH